MTDARTFYMERIPEQFNRALDAQSEGGGEEAERVAADMQAVSATLKIVVEGDSGGTFFLNVKQGRMQADSRAAESPFLTLVHDVAALGALERESGDSALGFLGGLAGMAGEIKLTRSRLQNLAGLSGAIRFEMTGEDGFALLTHFGSDPVPAEAGCSISVDGEAYRQLKAGELNPQDAFMTGKISVEGDMQMAMQLALAAMSPD